jgi:hypothetical protein
MRLTVPGIARAGWPEEKAETFREFGQLVRRASIARIRPAVGVDDVIAAHRSDHVLPLPTLVHLIDPVGHAVCGDTGPDFLSPPDELAQRERVGPHVWELEHHLSELLARHGHHHIRGGQVVVRELGTGVSREVNPEGCGGRNDLRRSRVSSREQPAGRDLEGGTGARSLDGKETRRRR